MVCILDPAHLELNDALIPLQNKNLKDVPTRIDRHKEDKALGKQKVARGERGLEDHEPIC
ncbi:unnamed protein product [Dovyalis caffra]|uniref:Uncharacterized protein n=1 Tax=Dovyalis caffra TaxID=77055 RepID=A0AAV1SNZ0_9ROSI|nr:unnamed protein product [Dovyalis caffra]